MKITLGQLRSIIRKVIIEAGGGTTLPHLPMIRDPMGPEFADREQLGRISTKDNDEEDLTSPHLREPDYPEEETWGPVPPTGEVPFPHLDSYAKDY